MAKKLTACFICGKKIEEGKEKDYFDGSIIQPVHRLCSLKPKRTKAWYKENRF